VPVRLVFILSFFWISLALAHVSVTTYNMGQLSSWGFDFVACTTERVEPQIKAIFEDKDSPIYKTDHFVLFIQEAWTWKIFRRLKRAAEKRGFKVYPRKFELLKNNGQMTITNLKPLEIAFHPYSIDKQSNKGMLYMKLDLGDGKTLGTLNVHTSYSTAYKASELHLVHLEEINKLIERFKRNSDFFVLGGDFNAGPDMEYKYQQYDAAKIIWNEGFIPHMQEHGLQLVGPLAKKTWEAKNPLVGDPPFIIQLSYFFWNLTLTWDQIDSTIDHVFVSESVDVTQRSVVFDKPVKLSCFGREDDNGLLPLSDHYGVNAVLKI
jgi:endonuclease/exonuclease/phosphatase family metal-dependent hydrolase